MNLRKEPASDTIHVLGAGDGGGHVRADATACVLVEIDAVGEEIAVGSRTEVTTFACGCGWRVVDGDGRGCKAKVYEEDAEDIHRMADELNDVKMCSS